MWRKNHTDLQNTWQRAIIADQTVHTPLHKRVTNNPMPKVAQQLSVGGGK